VNQPYFLTAEIITPAQGRAAQTKLEELVRDVLGPQCLNIVDAWGIPAQVFRESPAATRGGKMSWDKYNEYDNFGETYPRPKL